MQGRAHGIRVVARLVFGDSGGAIWFGDGCGDLWWWCYV